MYDLTGSEHPGKCGVELRGDKINKSNWSTYVIAGHITTLL
jgi:hypothetical protein